MPLIRKDPIPSQDQELEQHEEAQTLELLRGNQAAGVVLAAVLKVPLGAAATDKPLKVEAGYFGDSQKRQLSASRTLAPSTSAPTEGPGTPRPTVAMALPGPLFNGGPDSGAPVPGWESKGSGRRGGGVPDVTPPQRLATPSAKESNR